MAFNPRRMLTIDATAYPPKADGRDEYNDPVLTEGDPVPLKVWLYQATTTEDTVDTDQATETWTVFAQPVDNDWDSIAGLDHLTVLEVPSMHLRLQVNGTPHTWTHPLRGPLYIELTADTLDDGWVS